MQILVIAVLVLSSICAINGYGPPPRKTKHRTTTTTIEPPAAEPSHDGNNPTSNSVYTNGSPVEQPQSGPYPQSGPSSSSYSPDSHPSSDNNYWWQGPSSPFNPQQPLPAVLPNQPTGSNPTQPIGAHPSQSSPCGTQPNQGTSGASYTCHGTPISSTGPGSNGPYPNQKPTSGPYPSQGSSGITYPNQGSPNLNQGSPSGTYPVQGLPSGSPQGSPNTQYPYKPTSVNTDQGPVTGSYPNQGFPNGPHSNQGSPSGSYPHQISPTGSNPQGPQSASYPSQGSPSGNYPNQGRPSGSYPNQVLPNTPYPNPGTQGGSNPNQGSPIGAYPNQGSPSGSHPIQGSPSVGSYPNQGSPSGSHPTQGTPSGPYPNQGSPNPSSPAEPPQPINLANNPFLSSALGINKPGCSNSYGGCGSQGNPQYQGTPQPQQPVGGNQPQYSGPNQGTQYPGLNQGQPQYPGVQGQKPYTSQGQPVQPSYPQGNSQPQIPTGPQAQYSPNTPQQPQIPQYASTNNVPGGSKFPPPFPGANAPAGEQCNQPGYLCVAKSACNQGVLTQSGIPGRAGICNLANEACCKIPAGSNGDAQRPQIGYGNGNVPGTNGVPIGGSIYDKPTAPSYVTPAAPVRPYTGPLNTTPYPGCSAALKCVPITYCTAEGVMADSPVYLTREQQENRVPLTDCMNTETNVIGKCCRDPNYKDPWPAGMMMAKSPTDNGFDDGQYHPPQDNKFDDGQYHPPSDNKFDDGQHQFPEQETSDTFSHQAGIYYNNPSTTPKGHTIKKPIGNFNQKPTPFPTKPAVQGTSGRLPAPVYEDEFLGKNDAPAPSNEITPQGQHINIGYNTPNQPNSSPNPSSLSQEPSGPGKLPPQPTYQPLFSQQQSIQPGQTQPFINNQPKTDYPSRVNLPINTGYSQEGNPDSPQSQQTNPNQPKPGYFSGQPNQSSGYQPTQPQAPYQPNQPTGHQPTQAQVPYQPNQPAGYQPTQAQVPYQPTGYQQREPDTTNQNNPHQIPSTDILPPNQYQPNPSNNPKPLDSRYTVDGQPAPGASSSQIPPGSSCGVRHKAYTNSPDEAGESEFPWQALITSAANKTFLCGGAIVSENAVVTAAHCIEDFRSKDLLIKAGILKLLVPTEGTEQVRPVKAIARHPDFDTGSLAKDLAVLIIAPSFNPTNHVDKICLPQTQSGTQNSNTCVVTGWGRQALKGPIPNSVLHKVDVSFMENEKCENILRETHLGKYFILNKGFSCAAPKTQSDLCKVDVGGPLACERQDGHYELAGVNSWDVNCPAEKTPTVFSNPDAEWIQKITQSPIEQLEAEEEQYNVNKLKGESLDTVDIDQKPGFALGYGK